MDLCRTIQHGIRLAVAAAAAVTILAASSVSAQTLRDQIYDPGPLKPIDSRLKVRIGERAPDFSLPSVAGGSEGPGSYRGRKNVVLSFIPSAFTPMCSDQWPGYNLARPLFEAQEAVLLGISVDNIPTLYAWTRQMGALWFPVLSDFWPHGRVAGRYGLLRTDGVAERALIFIDKRGILRDVIVSDINKRPDLETVVKSLERLNRQ